MKSRLTFLIFSLLVCSYAGRSQPLQKIFTLAGTGFAGFAGDGANASGANLWGPIDVALDGVGNLYVSDHFNYRVRKINAGGFITTIAGNGIAGNSGNGSIGSSAQLVPRGVAVDKSGNVYISDDASCVIRKVNGLGLISTIAGVGLPGYFGDGGNASVARLSAPSGMNFDTKGNLYIADMGNHVIRKIDTGGKISTVAGNHTMGYSGDAGPATDAALDSPYAVAADAYGNIYIVDYGNNVIRKVDTNSVISTYAGKQGVYGYAGDNQLDTAARFSSPRGIAVDKDGNVFISDANNNVIRRIDRLTEIITTVVGNGTYGFGGDLGYATGANLFNPYGLTVDALGCIYIADANNERVRKTYNIKVGVDEIAASQTIQVYPNPVVNAITVSGIAATDDLILIDVLGHKVAGLVSSNTTGPQVFNMSELPAGVYFLNVTNSGVLKSTTKVVKE